MGVPGLMTYLANCATVWQEFDLANSHLVIDGAAFAIHLFHSLRSEWRLGGDMRAYVSANQRQRLTCCLSA